MRGLKIYSTPQMSIAEPATIPIFQKAAELRFPILAHATPIECEYLMAAVPECTLMMAHAAAQPFAHGDWNRAIMAAKRFPNLYLETASSTIDTGFLETCVRELGPEKIIFGTDIPLLDPHFQLAKVARHSRVCCRTGKDSWWQYSPAHGTLIVRVLDINGFIGKWPYWPVPATEPKRFVISWTAGTFIKACICSTRSLFVNWQDGNCETLVDRAAEP